MRTVISKPMMTLALLATLGMTAACENPNGAGGWGTKQTVGTGLGAVGGGLLGSQIGGGSGRLVATGVGAVLGGLIGNEIGSSLDSADRAELARASERAYSAPIGSQITWNNPNSGNYGTVVPVRDGRDSSGAYCREFNQKVTVGGRTQDAFGTACQQPDGTWRIISQ